MLAGLVRFLFGLGAAEMSLVQDTGINKALAIDNPASEPPRAISAIELNPGGNMASDHSVIPGRSNELPVYSAFSSSIGDGSAFQANDLGIASRAA